MKQPNVSSVCVEINTNNTHTARQFAQKFNQEFFEGKFSTIIVSKLELDKFLVTLAIDDDTASSRHDEYLADYT